MYAKSVLNPAEIDIFLWVTVAPVPTVWDTPTTPLKDLRTLSLDCLLSTFKTFNSVFITIDKIIDKYIDI